MEPGCPAFFLSGRSAHHKCSRQQCMWSSPLFWMVFAIASFWALGAYNRLMRLRSAVAQAFGSFDAHMVRLVALLGEFSAAHAVQRASPLDGADHEMAALQGATTQLSACLAVARARPLAVEGVAALAAARDVLNAAWLGAVSKEQKDMQSAPSPQRHNGSDTADTADGTHSAHSADSSDGAPAPAPVTPAPSVWRMRWDEHALQNDQAARVFNDAVAQYNGAIAQFPANVLARVFGFKAARGL